MPPRRLSITRLIVLGPDLDWEDLARPKKKKKRKKIKKKEKKLKNTKPVWDFNVREAE
jgi:hypothetical protein